LKFPGLSSQLVRDTKLGFELGMIESMEIVQEESTDITHKSYILEGYRGVLLIRENKTT